MLILTGYSHSSLIRALYGGVLVGNVGQNPYSQNLREVVSILTMPPNPPSSC